MTAITSCSAATRSASDPRRTEISRDFERRARRPLRSQPRAWAPPAPPSPVARPLACAQRSPAQPNACPVPRHACLPFFAPPPPPCSFALRSMRAPVPSFHPHPRPPMRTPCALLGAPPPQLLYYVSPRYPCCTAPLHRPLAPPPLRPSCPLTLCSRAGFPRPALAPIELKLVSHIWLIATSMQACKTGCCAADCKAAWHDMAQVW